MSKKQLKNALSIFTLFLTINLTSETIQLSSNDQLSIPLPLPYNGFIYSEGDIEDFMNSAIDKYKQPVIIFGGNWCPDCRILDGTLQIPTIKKFMKEHYKILLLFQLNMSTLGQKS